MTIGGRTPRDCFDQFEAYVRELVSKCLGPQYIACLQSGNEAILSFRDSTSVKGVPLQTAQGRVYLFMWQQLEAVEQADKTFTLVTRQYKYRVQETESYSMNTALLRFEYSHEPHPEGYPRHHVQMPVELKSESIGTLDFNKLHLPTGWVTMEEVLRFLIADLGVRAACGDDSWDGVLSQGYEKFLGEFSRRTSSN